MNSVTIASEFNVFVKKIGNSCGTYVCKLNLCHRSRVIYFLRVFSIVKFWNIRQNDPQNSVYTNFTFTFSTGRLPSLFGESWTVKNLRLVELSQVTRTLISVLSKDSF